MIQKKDWKRESVKFGVALGASTLGVITSMIGYTFFRHTFKKPFIEKEIDKIVAESKTSPKNSSALVIKTSYDPSGSFSNHSTLEHFQILSKNHSISQLTESSKNALLEKTNKISETFDKIIVMGHGNASSIELAKNTRLESTKEWTEKIQKLVKKDGILVLGGCSTGSGNNSLGHNLAVACKRTVYAPNANINSKFGTSYDTEGIPTFRDSSGNDVTEIMKPMAE